MKLSLVKKIASEEYIEDEDIFVLRFFDSFDGGGYVEQHYCKESFIRCWDHDAFCLFFLSSDKIKKGLQKIERKLGLPVSKFKEIELKFENGLVKTIRVDNPFWFQDKIRLDMFCCLYKTLVGCEPDDLQEFLENTVKLNTFLVTALLDDNLYDFNYFEYPFMLWALYNIQNLPSICAVTNQERFLFNFDCNGLVSALHKWTDSYKCSQKIKKEINEFGKFYKTIDDELYV